MRRFLTDVRVERPVVDVNDLRPRLLPTICAASARLRPMGVAGYAARVLYPAISFGISSEPRCAWSSISITRARYGDLKGTVRSCTSVEKALRVPLLPLIVSPYAPRFAIAGTSTFEAESASGTSCESATPLKRLLAGRLASSR